jgi:hypothetical protein
MAEIRSVGVALIHVNRRKLRLRGLTKRNGHFLFACWVTLQTRVDLRYITRYVRTSEHAGAVEWNTKLSQ